MKAKAKNYNAIFRRWQQDLDCEAVGFFLARASRHKRVERALRLIQADAAMTISQARELADAALEQAPGDLIFP